MPPVRDADLRTSALHFAARPRFVAHYLGQTLLAAAALTAVPAVFSLLAGDTAVAARYGAVIATFSIAGALGARLPVGRDLQRNEALVVAALAFVLPPLALAWPLSGYGLVWDDALFEAVSGITTTGLTMLSGLDGRPPGLLFARAWLQWTGGLGIVALVLAIAPNPGMTARHLGFSRFETSDIAGGTRSHARHALLIYALLTVTGFLVLWLLQGDALEAVLHAFSAVSTGGFSSHDASIAALHTPSRFVILALCFAGAVAFYTYYNPAYSTWRALLRDPQLKGLLGACILTAALLYLLMPEAGEARAERMAHALGIGFSAQTDAGFSTLNVAALGSPAQLVLIGSMLVGGAMGSTAGGIKIVRLLILMRLARLLFVRLMTPASARVDMQIGGAALEREELETMMAVIACFGAALAVSWLIFLAHGYAPFPALFEVSSALATCGLSIGLVSPDLPSFLKVVLCIDMWLGRVEIVALIVLFLPGTWIGRRRRST